MPFEYAVRPFQTPGAQGRVRVPSAPQSFDQRATLTWGNKTTLDSMGKRGISVTTHWPDDPQKDCCVEESAQQSNEMDTVTVANEGANGGSVTFQRARKLQLDKTHEDKCNNMDAWYNNQIQSTSASILNQYPSLGEQMSPRAAEPEKCKVAATFNNI